MSLITHPPHATVGSCLVLSSKSQQWSKGSRLSSVVCFNYIGQSNKHTTLNYCRKWRVQPIILKRPRSLKVYSFKGNSPSDKDPRDGPNCFKKTASLSRSQHEREDVGADSGSAIGDLVPLSHESNKDTITGSQAVENLFKRWLILLRSQKSGVGEEIHIRESGLQQTSDTDFERPKHLVLTVIEAIFLHIWALDATLKIPLLIFPPAYLAVRLVYGVEVTMELTPLWVLGPILVALYINIIRGLCFLYAFCFRQTKKLIINLPTYYVAMTSFVGEGRLNAYIHQKVWYPIDAIKNIDYKEFLLQKLKQLIEWANEKRLDYVESVWPYYCRTIRFLKRANLI